MLAGEIAKKFVGPKVSRYKTIELALHGIVSTRPDLVVLDLYLGEDDGLEFFEKISKAVPKTRWLLLTCNDKPMVLHRAIRLGIDGIVFKNSSLDDLLNGIRRVLDGNASLCARAQQLLTRAAVNTDVNKLTEGERELLALIGDGQTIKEAAEIMALSQKTLHNRLTGLRDKLKVDSMVDIARYAISVGLSPPP